MLRFVLITIVAACLGSTQAVAQQADAWQQLRRLGHRMTEGTWHQKLPKTGTGKHTYKWALGNQYLLVYMRHDDVPSALRVIGVDPVTKLQTWWTFQDDGDVHITAVNLRMLTPNTDKADLSGDRALFRGSFELTWSDGDTVLDLTPLEGAKKGEEDALKGQWRRSVQVDDVSWIDAEAPAELPEQLSLLRHVSGQKWLEGEMPDGIKFVGVGHGKWILNGKFFIHTETVAKADGTTWSHVVITGIDPSTNQARSWEFGTDGRSDITYSKTGTTIYGKFTPPNGDTHSFEGQFTVAGEALRYRSKIAKEGEEPKPYGWDYRDAK